MGTRLEGKCAIVTGAGSGMGRAIAKAFVAEGARVVCADITGRQDDTARALGERALGGERALAVQVDVSVAADVAHMVETAEAHFGRLDIFVNGAGISGGLTPFHEIDDDTFDRVIAVNLRGVFLGMKHAIAAMLRGGGGTIVNIASAGGLVGNPLLAGYCASKGGVVQLTRTAALEYAQRGIRANAICPGRRCRWMAG